MTNPTSNYNFQMPTAINLVTNLPADFEVFGQAVDTRLKALQPGTTNGDIAYSTATANTSARLAIGTTGQVLTVAGGVPTWAISDDANAIQNAIVDAKGDLISATANDTPARLAVGANDGVLSAASGETTGLKYAGLTQTYTPAYSGTVGNGTINGKWVQVGKIVNVFISLTLGSTTVIASDSYFGLPINASTNYIVDGASSLGGIVFRDAGTASYFGIAIFRGSSFVNVNVANVSGTYGTLGSISSTVPFTWTSTDSIVLNLSYQVA